jgi:uncharacterized membrane protein
MIYFVSIFIFLSVLALLESINPDIIPVGTDIFVFIILVVFAGSRPIGADNDSLTYLAAFESFTYPEEYFNDWAFWGQYEPFYYLIPTILKFTFEISKYYIVVFYLYAFLGCLVTMTALKKLPSFYYTSILTLFCGLFIIQEMTQIRAAIAVGFYLHCIRFKVNQQWVKFIICIFISGLFHYSSVLIFAVLFVSERKFNRPILLAGIFLAFLLSFVNIEGILGRVGTVFELLASKQDAYIADASQEHLNKHSLVFILHLVNTLLLVVYADRIQEENKYTYIFAKLQVFGLILFQLLSPYPTIAYRIFDFFLTTHLITLAACLYLVRQKFWLTIVICLLNLATMLALIYRTHLINLDLY